MKVDGLEIVEPGLRYQFRDGRLEVTAGMDPAFENGYVLLSQALNLRAERDAALARVKELEGTEVKLIETSGACFRVARQHQLESGEHPATLADWLESRLKRLAELEAEVADDACYRVVARYKEDRTIPGATWLEDRLKRLAELEKGTEWRLAELKDGQREAVIRITQLKRDLAARLLELGAIRRAANVHGFIEGGLAAWLDMKLTGNAGQLANYHQMSLEWRGREEALKRKLAELEDAVADLRRWNGGKDAQLHETEEERAALAIKVAGLENVVAYWKDRHLAAAGVRDRLAERLLPIAQQFGYQGNEGELGAWLERAIRARAELAHELRDAEDKLSAVEKALKNSSPSTPE